MNGSKQIIVIEDDADSRLLIGECLRLLNAEVFEIADGKEALDYLRLNLAPALIFMDLSLPGLSGQALIPQLRAMPHLQKTPIVILSGWDDLASRCKLLGADGFLKKPYQLEDLLETAKKHVPDLSESNEGPAVPPPG